MLEILGNFRILILILYNEFKNWLMRRLKATGQGLYNEIDTFSKLVYDDEEGEGEEENVRTYQILGSLEILAIKKVGVL